MNRCIGCKCLHTIDSSYCDTCMTTQNFKNFFNIEKSPDEAWSYFEPFPPYTIVLCQIHGEGQIVGVVRAWKQYKDTYVYDVRLLTEKSRDVKVFQKDLGKYR